MAEKLQDRIKALVKKDSRAATVLVIAVYVVGTLTGFITCSAVGN